MPRVSVIIPVHNSEPFVRECIDSVLGQTLEDIEVLCVDDGSTDGSARILGAYAASDPRVRLLQQERAGAGAARNRGLERACGEYLSFLDADDSFEPTMLEDTWSRCQADSADIGIYKTRRLDTRTGHLTPADRLLKTDLLPETVPFSVEDMPDHILDFVSPVPWDKMFRREFVLAEGLRFQETARANDLFFTKLALVKARRITVVDKYLVNYRVGHDSSLQANNHETPLDFLRALEALRGALQEAGEFSRVERSFVNEALTHCLYNLDSLKTADSFCELYDLLRTHAFADLGIIGRPREYFYDERRFDQYVRIMDRSATEYLFEDFRSRGGRLAASQRKLKRANAMLAKRNAQLAQVQSSMSYRMRVRAAVVLRRLRRLIPG